MTDELPVGRLLTFFMDQIEQGDQLTKGLWSQLQERPVTTGYEAAMALDPKDFEDANPQVRIGLSYMKGRMQNLEQERDEARAYAVQLREQNVTSERELNSKLWAVRRDLQAANDDLRALREKHGEEDIPEEGDYVD